MSADPERAVERLLDDETLRGDLEDDAFSPIVDVVSEIAIARAGRFATTDDLYLALRNLTRGAVAWVEDGDRQALMASLVAPLASRQEQRALARSLAPHRDNLVANAEGVARALAQGLVRGASPTTPERDRAPAAGPTGKAGTAGIEPKAPNVEKES